MLGKKWVEVREYIEETNEVWIFDAICCVFSDLEQYQDALKNPWKAVSGAVKHFLKRIQIVSFRLVEMFTVADIEADEEGVFEECREYSGFADTLIITDKAGNIRIYEGQILETVRADLSGEERNQKLGWLIPYVQQFRVLDKLDMLVSEDLSVMLKAVAVSA